MSKLIKSFEDIQANIQANYKLVFRLSCPDKVIWLTRLGEERKPILKMSCLTVEHNLHVDSVLLSAWSTAMALRFVC